MGKKIHSRIKSKAKLRLLKKKIQLEKQTKAKREKRKALLRRIVYHSLWIPIYAYAIYRLFT